MLELAQLGLGYCNILFLRRQHSEVLGGAETWLSPSGPGQSRQFPLLLLKSLLLKESAGRSSLSYAARQHDQLSLEPFPSSSAQCGTWLLLTPPPSVSHTCGSHFHRLLSPFKCLLLGFVTIWGDYGAAGSTIVWFKLM